MSKAIVYVWDPSSGGCLLINGVSLPPGSRVMLTADQLSPEMMGAAVREGLKELKQAPGPAKKAAAAKPPPKKRGRPRKK